jgi:hypothetical protein
MTTNTSSLFKPTLARGACRLSMAIEFSPLAATNFPTGGHLFSPLVATNLPTNRLTGLRCVR